MAFSGIPPAAFDFYERLEADNSKAFWQANKGEFDDAVKAPVHALCHELADLGSFHVFRPYNDVRFAKNRPPYKTHQGAYSETDGGCGYYFHIGADGMMVAVGQYRMAADQLGRYRAAVDDEASGAEVERIVAALTEKGYSTATGDELKSAPRGYPRDHPRIELLRHKGLIASRQFPVASWMSSKKVATRVRDTWRGAGPLTAWLDANVGPSTLPPDDRMGGRRGDHQNGVVTVTDAPHADALERLYGLADRVVDETALANSIDRFRERSLVLPTFAELADPAMIDHDRVGDADPQGPDARNLFRVHWYNDLRGARVAVPDHIVLPSALTGVESPIIVVFGDRFPMITAHKVLAAYACLAPRIVTGQFDPTSQRAIWPSTGNYARGGIAISRIMASRGVAILPEGMSRERFDWLDQWCEDPADDVIRTPGTESNVKEIYDACNELALDPTNVVLNQFCEFGNHLAHYEITGRALEHVFETVAAESALRLAAFVSATGSAGTIGAGDRLKDTFGTRIVAVEALECPTMLENGFGEHNIQGIGDKHIPLIHNVMNTDVVIGVSDTATDELDLLYNSETGRALLARKGVADDVVDALTHFGFSSTCNVVAAIKTAKLLGLGPHEAIITVATDGGAMYPSERAALLAARYGGTFTDLDAAEVFGRHLADVDTDATIECTARDRTRIFNLGYYTWVEQQGTPFELFEQRRQQSFWRGLRRYLGVWDEMITEFNARVGTPT